MRRIADLKEKKKIKMKKKNGPKVIVVILSKRHEASEGERNLVYKKRKKRAKVCRKELAGTNQLDAAHVWRLH